MKAKNLLIFVVLVITSATSTHVWAGDNTPPTQVVNKATPPKGRIINVSTRGRVRNNIPGEVEQVMIAGISIQGGSKQLVVRVISKSLADLFGVNNCLQDLVNHNPAFAGTRFSIHTQEGQIIGNCSPYWYSGGWVDNQLVEPPPTHGYDRSVRYMTAVFNAVGAFIPTVAEGNFESGTLFPDNDGTEESPGPTQLVPGTYTIQARPLGRLPMSGVILVEVYDYDWATHSESRLTNISTRGYVLPSAADSMIVGFAIVGGPLKVLIRAIGPGLTGFGVSGVANDPTVVLYNRDGVPIVTNDDWNDPVVASSDPDSPYLALEVTEREFLSTGAFLLKRGSNDSAVVVELPAGTYTAVAGGFGEALVEVYEIP